MPTPNAPQVTPRHLARNAYLYVRQSTLRQVLEHTESTARQYALRQRALALGWPAEQIVVIDCDQGQSGASAADRAGFQQLVAEVGLGHAGIVLGLEVSRLARSSTDWHRLLELCALGGTLRLDEDGLYDPGSFNDRLLLGLKGTMSEAELHVLRARLLGGVLSKARRGELKLPLPVGFVYDALDRVVLAPDQQVQQAVRLLFQTFRRTGSAWMTVKLFREQELLFPRRVQTGPRKGELVWGPLPHNRVRQCLHNPRYAGAFCYGRTVTHTSGDGHLRVERVPRAEWQVLIRDAHPGYITWAEYEETVRRLRANAQTYGGERRASPPREGPALLQGLVVCGRCGERMTVRYHTRGPRQVPTYLCQREGIKRGQPICQQVQGDALDTAIGALLLEALTPLALEVTLAVQEEVQARAAEADRLRGQRVQRARHEAELAQHRYRRVHPDHRLVADALEAEWNATLRELAEAQDAYERQRAADQRGLNEQQRAAIRALATDIPRLWRDPRTPDRERKRVVRLLLADVTLRKEAQLTAHVRFRGGATRTLALPLPLTAWQQRQTHPAVVAVVDDQLNGQPDGEVAALLNARRLHSGTGHPFTPRLVANIRRAYHLPDRFSRLRAQGWLTVAEMAVALGVCTATVKAWRALGLLRAAPYNAKGECLYEPPGVTVPVPVKGVWKRRPAKTAAASTRRGAV
jgi:DNA invertase Pin-like site-specific DNA recombinase